jgi:hypothetical protein
MKFFGHIIVTTVSAFLLSCSKCDIRSLVPVQPSITRTWIGPEYWSNPLMNWQLSDGRIECTHGGLVNEVHSLTHQLVEGDGDFQMQAKIGIMDRNDVSGGEVVFAGFKLGAVGHRNDYRSNIYYDIESGFAEELMQEPPFQVGIASDGRLVINSKYSEPLLTPEDIKECQLTLEVSYSGNVATIRLLVDRANGERIPAWKCGSRLSSFNPKTEETS